jgi:integrase
MYKFAKFMGEAASSNAAKRLGDEVAVIQRIEAGYREILRTVTGTVAAKLLPETQAAAALSRAAYSYHELTAAFQSAIKGRKELTLQSFRIKQPDGSSYSPDGVLAGIVNVATMTLLLLGHQHKWFASQKFLVLPNLPEATEDEVYKAGLTELLAASWRNWERMEQRCRYFGGEIKVFVGSDLPAWAPEGAETAIEYDHITDIELFDCLANDRLNDRLIQTFQEMALQIDMQSKAFGISAPLSLPPGVFVSPQEGHADVSLSEILGYSVVDDQERPCGLRLVEWVRGYAALQCLAAERYSLQGKNGLYFSMPRETLAALLDRVGLKDGAAKTFIDQASLRATSRDLFDQPLIRMQDGSLLIFGPGILNCDAARVTLSAIGNQREQLGRRGKAFEGEILRFFEKQGFAAKAFKFRREGEEFEYDVVVPWDDHIFVFECKNRTLSAYNPVAAYHFSLEAKILRDAYHGERRGSRSWPEAVASWVKAEPRAEGDRRRLYRITLAIGDLPLAAVDQAAVDRVRAKLLQSDASPATVRRGVITPIRAVLRHAHRRGWCDAPTFEIPKQPEGRTLYLLPDQAERLIAAAAPHIQTLILLLLDTGARMSEASELEWRDVDLAGGRVIFWRTKTGRRRNATLSPRTIARLASLPHREGQVIRWDAPGRQRSAAYADRGRQGGGQIKTAWRGTLRRAGLATELTPHDLRHTWASWHYALNRDLLLLKVEGGWSSVALVERYAHLMPQGHEQAIRQFWHHRDTKLGEAIASA